ncbi:osmolarity sensor protein [Hartmannibacter diazotrophicus]|uniref:Osmolarity sensor protein n=1 Tax=Hartmannibacter diazotrophicus TaxID=1482074 RepID=A0A2C9DCB0_9HYPH|nr:DUF3365 domain-containing protein [Hartmannibacter diazotrophicus]SON57810.1 osmolarity sensor protein [Hartmannibacter diazotrophicus]
MGLRLKFNLVLLLCYILGLAVSVYPFYQISKAEVLEQLRGQIDILRSQALAVRKYTSDEIQPLLAEFSSIQFLPQSVPSFSAQTAFRNFQAHYPDFFYKEAALNPTNPADLAEPWEKELIEKLRADPELPYDISIREQDGETFYTGAFPLTIRSESCLSCHSTPDRAVASMVALYGDKNGFGWQLNETIGAQIFSVPMKSAEERIWNNLLLFVGTTSAIFLFLMVFLNLLLNLLVISPVLKMAKAAEAVSMGDATVPEFDAKGADEIASLSRSFNRMRRSLDSALKMLGT